MQQSSTATDRLLAFNCYWAQEDFIHDFSQHKNSRLSELKLKTSRDFNWTLELKPLPLFMTIQQTREAVEKLNESLVNYTVLLLNLSDRSLINEKSFTKLAKQLNNTANQAVNTMALQVPAQDVKLLSKASSEAMLLYLRHRQRSALQAAIKQNQPNIEKYAASSIILLDITGSQIKVYYSAHAGRLIKQWRSADHKIRLKLTQKMLDLNQRYISALKIAKELHYFYTVMPKANIAVAESLNPNLTSLPALIKLSNSADRLLELQKSLKKYLPVKKR